MKLIRNKAVIFDLDGVLVDSKDIHYKALNESLSKIDEKYLISKEDHKILFEGLPTKEKLKILTETKGLPEELHDVIQKEKQKLSVDYFNEIAIDEELIEIFEYLKQNSVKIAVATNSINATAEMCLARLGIRKFINLVVSNEDVEKPKPDPEIYFKTFLDLKIEPQNAIIFEDSIRGKTAAYLSGARLISISNRKELTLDKIKKELNFILTDMVNVEEVYLINSQVTLLKVKNVLVDALTKLWRVGPIFNADRGDPTIDNPNCFGRYKYSNSLINTEEFFKSKPIPKEHEYIGYDAYVKEFNENTLEKYDNKDVFIIQYTSRYFHIMLDILPKLIVLKKINPNFHLILLSSTPEQKVEKSGMFYGLERDHEHETHQQIGREENALVLRQILEELDISFSCCNSKDILDLKNQFCFKNLYLFYEKRIPLNSGCKDNFENYWEKGLRLETSGAEYDHAQLAYKHNNDAEFEEMNLLSEFYKNEDNQKVYPENIYISRKNYKRAHLMENETEEYFNKIGYETVYFEDYSIQEQINFCREAKNIVCYLGTSIVNIIISKTKANVYIINLDDPALANFSNDMISWYSRYLYKSDIKNSILYAENRKDLDFVKNIFNEAKNEQ